MLEEPYIIKYLRFILSFFFIGLLCTVNVIAQKEISGKAIDKSGQALSDVVIKLKNHEISTVSDAEGKFKFWLPDDIKTVEFSDYKDFRFKEVKKTGDNDLQVVYENKKIELLDLSLEEILNFEVSVAGKTEEKVSEIPASVIIITRKEIENYGYTNIMELLQHISGLYMINGYTSDKGTLGVRGFWADDADTDSDNYAIMINNIYQYNLKLALPIQAIDRVEVIRGPMSVIYGSGSMYGAINIVTNEGETNLASVSYGNNNTLQTYAGITGNNDDYSYSFNMAYEKTDGINVKYRDMMGDENFSEYQSIEGSYGTVIPDDYSTKKHFERELHYINFFGSFKDVYLSASHVSNYVERFFLYPAFNKGHSHKISNTRFTLGYKKEFTPTFSLDARVSYSYITKDYVYDFFADLFYGNQLEYYSKLESVIDLNYAFSKKLNVVAGTKISGTFNYKNITDVAGAMDPMLTNRMMSADIRDGNVAFFSQINYKPFQNLKFIGGIRLEEATGFSIDYFINGASLDTNFTPEKATIHFESSDILVIPRLAAVYTLKNNHIFKLLLAEATQHQVAGIEPKKQRTLEFDYLFTQKKYSIGFNVFRNYFWNVLNLEYLYDQETFLYTERYINSGNLTTNGIEFTILTQPVANFKLELGGIYQKTTDNNKENITVAYSPNLLGQAKILYQKKNFSFGITGYYVGEMESLWISEKPATELEPSVPGYRLGDKAGNYFIVGTNVRLNNIYKGLFVSLRISNIFNTEIRYPTIQTTSTMTKGTYGQERNLIGSIGWKF